MRKIYFLVFILFAKNTFAQINSPNGNNIFYYNGLADVIFRYADRGAGGRAFVHAPNNVLSLNYAEDFYGGTMIGKNVYFKDDGNSFISSGNFGIGLTNPETRLHVFGGLTVGSESVNANTTKIFLKNPYGKTWAISSGTNMVTESSFSIYNWSDNQSVPFFHIANNGNIGIGNFQPDAPLTVYGKSHFFPARIGSGDARSLEISNTASFPSFISNDYPVFLKTGGGDQPLILDAAKVGIGTSNPTQKLEVNGNGLFQGAISSSISDDGGGRIQLQNSAKTANGIASTWTIYNMTGVYGNSLQFWAYDNLSCGSGMCNNRFTIMDSGNVGIGTTNPDSKLAVNGTIHSKEVKVDMNGWSDFVFKKEYDLPTLEEVEKHINEKGHLKNIPNEDEVLKNGINLGEMNGKLLQKIEEMTLYMIEQNKKIIVLEKKMEKIKSVSK